MVIELTLLPALGGLAITARVAGAEVWVGNDKLGETTAGGTLVRDKLPPGSYQVERPQVGLPALGAEGPGRATSARTW